MTWRTLLDECRLPTEEGLGLYNVAMTGFTDSYPVTIFLKDKNGEIMGGVLGHI